MPEQSTPDITVSIVSHNTRELLRACLRSLLARQQAGEARLQIMVADNDSQDGSVAMVEQEFPAVEVFATGGNLGYGRANNLSFERARAPYFLVLNSDTEVEPGALPALRTFMEAHPEAGAAGAQLVWPDGRPQASCGADPSLSGIFLEQTYLSRIFPRRATNGGAAGQSPAAGDAAPGAASVTGDMRHPDPLKVDPLEVEQLCGASFFARSEAYRRVGGFDPAYFMYHEDVELNIRLRRAGWRLFLVPEARIIHHLGASSRRDWQTRARMVAALNQSRYYYFSRHDGALQGELLKALFLLGAGLRLAGWTALALARPTAHEKVKLFRHVLRWTWKMRPEAEA